MAEELQHCHFFFGYIHVFSFCCRLIPIFDIRQADGFIVKHITLLANPNQVRPTRFWGVYTKLKIFNMTNYRKG
jgi:hypothetical protein